MKILFCGLGSIGQRHLRNVRALLGNDVDILAYRRRGTSPVLNADMTVRADAELETTYNLRRFDDLDAALNEQPDVVFITNPNSLHVPTALAAAQAGAHLFIEKPISDTLDGMDELIRVVDEKKLTAFVCYQFRWHPALQRMKAALDEGRLGQLAYAHIVNGEYLPDWHPYEDYRETHPARRDLGGGSLRIQTHEMDYALWFFGLPKRVFATGGHLSRLEVDVEDSVSILMQCEQENRLYPVHIHLDYLQRPPQRVCDIIGDRGKACYNYYRGELEIHDTLTREVEVFNFRDFDRNQMFVGALTHFLACLRGEAEPLIDLREGVDSMKIALAADESLRTSQSVALDK